MSKRDYWNRMRLEADLNCRWRVIALKFADRIHNIMTLSVVREEKRVSKIEETKREFPLLNKNLFITILKLYTKGTLRKKEYLTLAFRLNNRLIYEMNRYL